VDVVAALLVEWQLCLGSAAFAAESVTLAAAAAIDEPRLAPDGDLRGWDQQLAGAGPRPTGDELPEVALPHRLAVRIPKGPSIEFLANLEQLSAAIAAERAASRRGMTMETWLLRQLLA
jgi:hypothetical protein